MFTIHRMDILLLGKERNLQLKVSRSKTIDKCNVSSVNVLPCSLVFCIGCA